MYFFTFFNSFVHGLSLRVAILLYFPIFSYARNTFPAYNALPPITPSWAGPFRSVLSGFHRICEESVNFLNIFLRILYTGFICFLILSKNADLLRLFIQCCG